MDGKKVQARAIARTEELPGATLEYPFGPEWEVFKVSGRVFMLVTHVTGAPIVIVKSDPEDAIALRSTYAEITPGYHMNKRHWITISGGASIAPELVDELVTESYRLVVGKLAWRQRPVDPEKYGRR